MQYTTVTVVLSALSTLVSLTTGSALPTALATEAPLPGFGVANLTWTGLNSQGDNVTISGSSVTNIFSQLKVIDPDWTLPTNTTTPIEPIRDPSHTDDTISQNCCPVGNWNWPLVNYNDIYTVANAIRPYDYAGGGFQVGQGNCGLVMCQVGAGVWLCADSATWDVNAGVIADYADDIAQWCPVQASNSVSNGVCGQIFDSAGYNIIVHAC